MTPPCRQAARKKATLRFTCGPISAHNCLNFSPNKARSIKGNNTKSWKKHVVVAMRSGARAGNVPRSSDCAGKRGRTRRSWRNLFSVRCCDRAVKASRPRSPNFPKSSYLAGASARHSPDCVKLFGNGCNGRKWKLAVQESLSRPFPKRQRAMTWPCQLKWKRQLRPQPSSKRTRSKRPNCYYALCPPS